MARAAANAALAASKLPNANCALPRIVCSCARASGVVTTGLSDLSASCWPPHLLHRRGEGRRQIGGRGLRRLRFGFAEFVDDFLELTRTQHRLREGGDCVVGRILQFERSAQFLLGAGQVTGLELGFPQEEAGFREVRILLQRISELDVRRVGVVLREQAFGRSDEGFGLFAAAAPSSRTSSRTANCIRLRESWDSL
jgi:hypothetical protein